jgi:cell division protein FtsL
MPAARKSENSDRGVYTRTEKQLLAMLCVIVSTIIFLLIRH